MKKHIKQFALIVLSFMALQSYSQDIKGNKSSEVKALALDSIGPYACDNGGFESGYTSDYVFKYGGLFNISYDCNLNTSVLTAFTPTGLNDFSLSTYATLVNTDTSVSGGFDPVLHSLSPPINIKRVNNGTYAMKLNDNVGRSSVTSMSKEFYIYDDFVSYSYSLIMHSPNGTANQPHFIVRLYDNANVEISEKCIVADVANPLFNSVAYGGNPNAPLLYTGWQCDTIGKGRAAYGDKVRLEFTITDTPFSGFEFGTVYIDDICNVPCAECQYCVNIISDVLSPALDVKEAEHCITASNTVDNGATANYDAGYEVLLEVGFESLYGSTGHYYIDGCSGNEDINMRVSKKNTVENTEASKNVMQVYPNPVNSELNIVAGDIAIKTISIMALDGKTININQQSDNGNYKLDMSAISQGIYLLTIEKTDGTVTTQKIIKN